MSTYKMKMIKNMYGQTLIEVLVSLSIAVIVISAITSVVITSLSNAQFSKTQTNAAQFAQEGLEVARDNLSSAEGSYCLDQNMTALPDVPDNSKIDATGQCVNPNINPNYNADPTGAKTMKRTLTINKTANTCPVPNGSAQVFTKVTVIVSWTDNKCPSTNLYCHQAKEQTCM